MQLRFRFFGLTFLAFVFTTIIGTLTHELGHWLVGESIGYDCKISYASCRCLPFGHEASSIYIRELFETYEVKECKPAAEWAVAKRLRQLPSSYSRIWMTIGGPLQTMLTEGIGLFFLMW